MIFHTSADKKFYSAFFIHFSDSISRNCENKKISLNFVGPEVPQNSRADMFSQNHKTLEDIEKEYHTTDRDSLGYYALSRWLSIPIINEHVIVCDIDIIAINKINFQVLEENLIDHPVINITRKKPNGHEGGMMIMVLRKDICLAVKEYAQKILIEKPLSWSRDVDVRSMLYERYSVKNILNMYQITKRTTEDDLKNAKEWFAFSKGNTEQKIQRISNAQKNTQSLVD
jgi:hypothetical protein